MTEVARTQGGSSEIERGEVPEVAALGNALKELFTRLGISQSQYAYRVHLDKSAVSRYLSGRRVPPQDFVDRLVQEIEEHVGAPLQLEAKEALRGRRLEALRVCSPDEYRLESLRDELARSRRDTERAHRNIEALNALLDKKEAEARDVADDLTRLRLDWGAERTALARAREDLLRQVEELRQDLRDAEALRAEAERQTRELRDHVLDLEEELSRQRPAAGPGHVPLEVFKRQIQWMWGEEDLAEAARDLTEAAWSRSLEDVAHLMRWLGDDAEMFVVDVARLRPLEDVLALAPEMARLGHGWFSAPWTAAVARRVTPGNAGAVYRGLPGEEGDKVLAEAVCRTRSDRDAVALFLAVLSDARSLLKLPQLEMALATKRRTDKYGLRASVELVKADWPALALDLLVGALSFRPWGTIVRDLEDMGAPCVDVLFDLAMESDDGETVTEFAVHLAHASTNVLCHQFLTALDDRGLIRFVDPTAHMVLKQAITHWRRSRGQ